MGIHAHRDQAPKTIRLGVVTVSTSRKQADDRSGDWIVDYAARQGVAVGMRRVVTDDIEAVRTAVREAVDQAGVDAVLVTGGTGLTPRDVTVEALLPLFDKELTAFGALFANLSYQEIGAAAMLSRATAGIFGQAVVFCVPGSPKACRLACEALIFPELGHLVGHIRQ